MRKTACVIAMAATMLAACRKEAAPATPATTSTAPKAATDTTSSKPRDLTGKVMHAKMPQVQFISKSALGSKLDQTGAVVDEATPADTTKTTVKSLRANDRIFLTMWLVQSPEGLQTSAKWESMDISKVPPVTKLVWEERKPANGSKVITFELKKKLKPGRYRVTGYWGGNDACDFDFEVKK